MRLLIISLLVFTGCKTTEQDETLYYEDGKPGSLRTSYICNERYLCNYRHEKDCNTAIICREITV